MRMVCILILLLALAALPVWCSGMESAEQRALTAYARAALLHRTGLGDQPVAPQAAQSIQRACFVTFFHKGKVFACFGGFSPRTASLADEVRENIRLALKNDPRARQITPEQATGSQVQITLPGPLHRISSLRTLDPSRDGLFVEAPDGNGVAIVPGEARTAAYALRSALARLGLTGDAKGVRLYRFSATIIRD